MSLTGPLASSLGASLPLVGLKTIIIMSSICRRDSHYRGIYYRSSVHADISAASYAQTNR